MNSPTLMISVSGMRGHVGTDLTPELVARHAAALGSWAASQGKPLVVMGRDARTSGPMFTAAAAAGFMSVGVDVIDLGVVPTPTVQMAVEHHHAGAGLIITASHNPIEWNALKFVGPDGVFLDAEAGATVRALAEKGPPRRGWEGLGNIRGDSKALARHYDQILALPFINVSLIRARKFRVALDTVRGAGGKAIPPMLEHLGCEVVGINLETDGRFPRPPEPLPENLKDLGKVVLENRCDIGMAVDPDVDRLALVDEKGEAIGEDYTLAFAVRAVLGHGGNGGKGGQGGRPGRTARPDRPVVVVNLSTSLVVEDAANDLGARFVRAPVGEANVARAMREEGALIGGEGNGGVMLPSLHIGRDAPLGVALILQILAQSGLKVSELVQQHPRYAIVKGKGPRGGDMPALYAALRERFPDATADDRDGLRLSWRDRWVHVRPSGTEPIVRYIAEAPTQDDAVALVAAAKGLVGKD